MKRVSARSARGRPGCGGLPRHTLQPPLELVTLPDGGLEGLLPPPLGEGPCGAPAAAFGTEPALPPRTGVSTAPPAFMAPATPPAPPALSAPAAPPLPPLP